MSNRLTELEDTLELSRSPQAKKRRNKRQPHQVQTRQPAPANVAPSQTTVPVAQSLGARVRSWQSGPGAPKRARAFTAIDYQIPGTFRDLAQPSGMTCWATVFTMLKSWREQQSMTIETALQTVGQRWADKFKANQGLSGSDKPTFISAAGLVAEPPQSYSMEGWENLLRNYGPIWVTTDEAPGKPWAIHARIIIGMHGDGTPAGTRFTIVDPAGGRRYTESIATFIPKYEEEVVRTGYMRIQVVHWQSDAMSRQRSLSYSRSIITPSRSFSQSYSAPTSNSLGLDLSGAMAAQNQVRAMGQSIDVRYNVQLVPQQTGYSCWAAGFAMIVGWRDQMSIDPSEIARATGYWAQYQSGLHPEDTRVMNVWGFTPEAPQSYTIQGFADLLRNYGPLWVASAEPGPHIRVVTGIQGDGTPDGTRLFINDPWEQGMTVFREGNRGSQYTETYRQFIQKQETLARREMSYDAPIYVAHLPQLPDWMNSSTSKSLSAYMNYPVAMEAPSNPSNYRMLTAGTWNGNTSLSVSGGQGMWFKIRNANVLGTTISIRDQYGQTKSSIILPQSSVEFLFTAFGAEPMGWRFDISTNSDAFIVAWELWSTWVQGMPPNR